ncbi:hypothetical protein VKT23_013857 [Stygiomarasmius scandens]|uniref:Aminoglycoside phosphotransferase domain-containing protein n=1 Tax=Marasmiellus scandens TaxID=2682957 RepID=A0ABR1J4N1_9AGAR
MPATLYPVNWDALSCLACQHYQTDGFHWGDHIQGGSNLIRFLHLHDDSNTILVARIPHDESAFEDDATIFNRIENEVAMMDFVKARTSIPIPQVVAFSTETGEVGSPYILMTKMDGIPLVKVWDEMEDEKRRVLLQQVVDILLQLWSIRFDRPGTLLKRSNGEWYIASGSLLDDSPSGSPIIDSTTYSNAADYWLAQINAKMKEESESDFRRRAKPTSYAMLWFMRSLIPALFDPAIDAHGFPLYPADFHSQNILITDIDAISGPRISAVIDWEHSGASFSSLFAHYPLFIVDHPAWDDDNPLRSRNLRDQATFLQLLQEAEQKHDHVKVPRLSDLVSKGYGLYLFFHSLRDEVMMDALYPDLFRFAFGTESNDFEVAYYLALTRQGILSKETRRFEFEHEVFLEAEEVLGKDLVKFGLRREEFRDLVLRDGSLFDSGGRVCQWLDLEEQLHL